LRRQVLKLALKVTIFHQTWLGTELRDIAVTEDLITENKLYQSLKKNLVKKTRVGVCKTFKFCCRLCQGFSLFLYDLESGKCFGCFEERQSWKDYSHQYYRDWQGYHCYSGKDQSYEEVNGFLKDCLN